MLMSVTCSQLQNIYKMGQLKVINTDTFNYKYTEGFQYTWSVN